MGNRTTKGKMFGQASALYTSLNELADLDTRIVEIDNITEFGVEHVNMSRGSVGQIMRRLQTMGSIEYQKGAINRKAVIRLKKAPTEDEWNDVAPSLTREISYDSLIKGFRDLQKQIGSLNVTQVIYDLSETVSSLKVELRDVQKELESLSERLDNCEESR